MKVEGPCIRIVGAVFLDGKDFASVMVVGITLAGDK